MVNPKRMQRLLGPPRSNVAVVEGVCDVTGVFWQDVHSAAMKRLIFATALAACGGERAAAPSPQTSAAAPVTLDECTRLRAPAELPVDPAQRARWEHAGPQRARMLEEMYAVMDQPCESWDSALATLFAGYATLLDELRALRHASQWHFDRWSDDKHGPTATESSGRRWRTCGHLLSEPVAAEVNALTIYRSCTVVQ
jgi:hypothetical protein